MDVQRGFTIIELMVTATIAGILLAVAVPFFRDIIISSRLNSVSLELADSLALARSESIKRNRTITFCRTKNSESDTCTQDSTATLWSHWLVTQNPSGKEKDVISRGSLSTLVSSIEVSVVGIINSQLSFHTDSLVRTGGSMTDAAQIIVCATNFKNKAARFIKVGAAGQIAIKTEDECK